jgi:hypothetical protein
MTIVDRNSTAIANAVASPRVLNDPQRSGGNLKEVVAVITSAADDTAASVGRFFRVPSNARVSYLGLTAADATTAGAIDIGLYDINDGAAVDADFFVSALDLTGGPMSEATDQKGESAVSYTTANMEKMIWELLGLSADPVKEYDVAYTITTTFNGGPTAIGLKMRYVA